MGIDSTQLISHNLYYKHTDELIHQVEQRTGLPVLTTRFNYSDYDKSIKAPKGFKGWTIRSEGKRTLQQFSAQGGMLIMYSHHILRNKMNMYVNPYLFEFNSDKFYMGRWGDVMDMANFIKDNGIPSPSSQQRLLTSQVRR